MFLTTDLWNGFSIPDVISQTFTDQNGNFDKSKMESYLTEFSKDFNLLKMAIGEQRLNEKMMFILNKGYFLNSLELEEINKIFTSKKKISYIFKPYNFAGDKSSSPTDLELIEYYKKHHLDSEYNVNDEEREVLIVNLPTHNGEDYITELLSLIKEQLVTTSREYYKVKEFRKIMQESKLQVKNIHLRRNSPKISPYERLTKQEEKEIKKLVFSDSSKVGDILILVNHENTPVKIVILSSIKYRNNVPFESVKERLSDNFIRTKDAEVISNKLKSVNTDEQLINLPNIKHGDTITEESSYMINGIGHEPKIVSSAFNIKELGVWSAPVSGNMGVYRIKVLNNENSLYPDNQIENYKEGIERDHFHRVNLAITESAQIIDNRWFIEFTD